MTQPSKELTPSERVVLRKVAESSRSYPERSLKSLEDKGLVYLSPAGYGLTDKGRELYILHFGPLN